MTQHFLDRIAKLDPTLHAFAHLDAVGALEQARRAEQEVASGGSLGPLHGVPFAVMDLIRVKGLPSAEWMTDSATRDDVHVERLRKAGAIVFGTLASYFFEPDEQPRNPWDTSRDPGNSSRGSASAVSAGMLPFTLAADGAGSTRLPAAWNGVLGLHPSRGLIPHVDFENPSLLLTTSFGPVTRDARDSAIVTQALAGPDGRDFVVIQDPPRDYLACLDDGVAGLRFAWTDDFGWSSIHNRDETPAVVAAARKAAFEFRSLGGFVDYTPEVWEDSFSVMTTLGGVFEAMGYKAPISPSEVQVRAAKLDEALGLEPQPATTLPELPTPSAAEYEQATAVRERLWDTTTRVLSDNDIIASPTTLLLPKTLVEWGLLGRDSTFMSYCAHTAMFNLLGFPALTIPCGFIDGLPVGMQLATRPGREDLLFQAAKSFLDAFPQQARPPAAS
ncbi:MAG: amidase [Actinomycetota bacterium]|nr:amidase [Actinomycetota bacterium]